MLKFLKVEVFPWERVIGSGSTSRPYKCNGQLKIIGNLTKCLLRNIGIIISTGLSKSFTNKGDKIMKMRVMGVVKEKESGEPISGLLVCAFDKDIISSDSLGKALTGEDGKFFIEYDSADFRETLDKNPDIYLKIYGSEAAKDTKRKRVKPIFTTKDSIRYSASSSEKFYIEIPRKKLI